MGCKRKWWVGLPGKGKLRVGSALGGKRSWWACGLVAALHRETTSGVESCTRQKKHEAPGSRRHGAAPAPGILPPELSDEEVNNSL